VTVAAGDRPAHSVVTCVRRRTKAEDVVGLDVQPQQIRKPPRIFGEELEARRIVELSREPGLVAEMDGKLVAAGKYLRAASWTLCPRAVRAAVAFLRPPLAALLSALLACTRLLVPLFRTFLSALLSCARLLVPLLRTLAGTLLRALLPRSGFVIRNLSRSAL